MIIIDHALAERERAGKPIRVGVFGAGNMATAFIDQVTNFVPGMCIAAVCNRTLPRAIESCLASGVAGVSVAHDLDALEDAIRAGRTAVTDDPALLPRSEQIDCLVDVTGAVDYGAAVALDAIACGKHLVLMNAEVDATIGGLIRRKADAAGVIVSACDGDQPGVQLNLWRYVLGMGMTPRVLGNVKGLQDPYRTPTTQQAFAERWHQTPKMVTSFADGSKVNFEQAIVANATGFCVPRRGMNQFQHTGHIDELTKVYDVDQLRELGGMVDYVVGAIPTPGVYCIAERTQPLHRHLLELYKLGEGPLYSFYHPYHLCHFEMHNTVARIVLFGDSCGSSLPEPSVEVVAIAKRDLHAGEVLDDYGEYMTYGEAENVPVVRAEGLVPEGLVAGCRLLADVAKDHPVRWSQVVAPTDSLGHRLYREMVGTSA